MEEVSKRLQKVQREVQRHLAEIIRSKGMAAFDGALVTVSEVRMSPDLSYAKIYISVFPSTKRDAVMKSLEEKNKAIRGELGRIVAKQFRIVPELSFFEDTTLDYVQHIDDLLHK
ncbi:MAG: 30S ribosome-binding factor RbfA [Candidatus Egerieousia sp.]